ncbi:MAG: hypothetical protein JNK30_17810 [Phenylobacterium sp.]|uniref:hypothetical protein n=1 Tax=Phenylobacterium sp. TaxID=1871053 RepID=UPI001A5FC8F4|nr:hypothetical protein [Phenylobacterium sp.]MBL8773243.1 hypothetical protein [Phenylobacterium sp.]
MNQTLIVATSGGLILQLAMVLGGHYSAFVRDNVFALGGMAISLLAGLVFAKLAAVGWTPSLAGGLVAGGVCALLGIAVSVALKDTAPMILVVGTLGSAVAGLLGAAVGKLLA